MTRSLAALTLAVAALLPTVAGTPTAGEPRTVTSPTVPASAGPGTGWPGEPDRAGAPGWPRRPGPVEAAGMPQPPPVNMNLVPSDWRPSPLPGVRQSYRCPTGSTPLTRADQATPYLWGTTLMRLPQLWHSAGSQGQGITLAVIDTGVAAHRLLAGRLVGAGDFVSGGTGAQDCDGHGTAVAGIAAAAIDPVTGFSGVAPGATVLGIRQTSSNFTTDDQPAAPDQDDARDHGVGNTITLARAIVDAVYQGANVINISLTNCAVPGVPGSAVARTQGVLQAAVHFAAQHNVVVVAAAGNTDNGSAGHCPDQPDASTVVLPGWFDQDVLTVGAINESGVAASFTYPGPWVDVAAPGSNLMSLSLGGTGVTRYTHGLEQGGDDDPEPIQGTSFAAPEVAGLAVLIRARYPSLTARQVIDRITATARGATARDWSIGYGTIDPVAALTRQPAVLEPPTAAATIQGTLLLAAPPVPDRGRTGAIWGGILGLLAVLAAAALAVVKSRSRRPTDPPHRSGPPYSRPPAGPSRR